MPGPPDPATTEWVPIWTPMNTGPVGPQGPQGTPGENWFAGTGAPAGSLATSIVGDWYLDTTTGDVYEKTGASTWTLRANIKGPQGVQGIQGIQGPIGATGPSGATAPHHVNHEVGGSDYLVNSAWLNQPNVFTQPQTVTMGSAGPRLNFINTNQAANQKQWQILGGDTHLYFSPADDTNVSILTAMGLARDGTVNVGKDLWVANNGGNVACKDQANVFTQPQTITSNGLARVKVIDTGQPADLRVFDIINSSQGLYLRAINDADTVVGGNAVLNRSGDWVISRDLYEKNRTIPMGHWQNEPFNAGNFVAAGGAWVMGAGDVIVSRFSLIGKTLNWYVYYSWFSGGNTVSGNPLTIYSRFPGALPGGAQNQRAAVDYAIVGGVGVPVGTIDCYPDGGVHLTFAYRDGVTRFPDGPFGCITHMTWEIN